MSCDSMTNKKYIFCFPPPSVLLAWATLMVWYCDWTYLLWHAWLMARSWGEDKDWKTQGKSAPLW